MMESKSETTLAGWKMSGVNEGKLLGEDDPEI